MDIINESNTENIYLTIPVEYSLLYYRIMQCLLDSGIDLLKDCECNCKSNKINIIFNCWYAFQSAIAAKKLQKEKEASLIIKYINAQLDLLCDCYNNEGEETDCECRIIQIDFNTGMLQIETNCESCNIPKFNIDPKTGNLYSLYENNKIPQGLKIIDNNLVQIS